MHAIPLFICSDLKCIEYNNFYNVCWCIIFIELNLQCKVIDIKNKRVKYSRDLMMQTCKFDKIIKLSYRTHSKHIERQEI